jgi:hypothetical protein
MWSGEDEMEEEVRCAGCGKPIEPRAEIAEVTIGALGNKRRKVWGRMHRNCFRAIVRSPQMVMDEIKKVASAL